MRFSPMLALGLLWLVFIGLRDVFGAEYDTCHREVSAALPGVL